MIYNSLSFLIYIFARRACCVIKSERLQLSVCQAYRVDDWVLEVAAREPMQRAAVLLTVPEGRDAMLQSCLWEFSEEKKGSWAVVCPIELL